MTKYIFDQENHLVCKESESFPDRVNTFLMEGFLIHRNNLHIPSAVWPFFQITDKVLGYFFRSHMMKRQQIVPNRIVLASFQSAYTCNCKYIAEKIKERGLDYQLVFLVSEDVFLNRKAYGFPDDVYLVRKNTAEAFYVLATSAFWIDNALNCIWFPIPKKKGQVYFNTWHGSLGIKRLSGGKYWRLIARIGNYQTDYFLTDSTFDEKVFTRSFWPRVKHLRIGHPRNDLFFQPAVMDKLREKVHNYYQIPSDGKLLLYAPTFRDSKKTDAIHVDFELLKDALHKRFGGKWFILYRLHFHNAAQAMQEAETGDVVNAGSYPDIQELLAAADAGITDYSSWIFDFLFTRRPAFIYATDIDEYIHSRGFYYSLDKTPFSIASSDTQLAENIQAFRDADYQTSVDRFLKGKGCYEAGNACDRFVDTLVDYTQNGFH